MSAKLNKIIPMSGPDITEAEIDAVVSVLRSGTLSIGKNVAEFENQLKARVGADYAAALSSGTAALHLAVIASGISAGDCAITSPFSFVASSNCLLYEGAKPVFVDVDASTGNIDPGRTAAVAADLKRSGQSTKLKALIPVHAFGQPADMDALNSIAADHGLRVIEDACEAIGAEYKGRPVGSLSDAATFAFYPNKQMTTGEGGMLVTRHKDWFEKCCSLRNQGRDVFDAWLNHSRLGYNYRLDEMSAALGRVQLQRLDTLLRKRQQVADWYTARLRNMELVETPRVAATTTKMSWFVYVIRVAQNVDRDRLINELAELGVPTRPYFKPIHLQSFYRERFGFKEGDFPVAEDLGRRSLALPFSSNMTADQVDYVCENLAASLTACLYSKHF